MSVVLSSSLGSRDVFDIVEPVVPSTVEVVFVSFKVGVVVPLLEWDVDFSNADVLPIHGK